MRRFRWEHVALGLVLLATAWVYSVVGAFDFAGTDDAAYVAANPWVRRGLTAGGVAYAFRETLLGNWHPLTWLSWMLDQELRGGAPGGFHVTNVWLHLLSTWLLFRALERLTGHAARSLAAAALFALHPLHVESVAWIAERKDALSGVFFMLGLSAWARYAARPGANARYALVFVLLALGLAAKPMLVTLPFVYLLLDFWPLRRLRPEQAGWPRRAWRLVLEKLPLLALSAAAGVATLRIHEAQQAVGDLSLLVRAANAALAYVAYLCDAVWPRNLAFFYPHPNESVSLARAAAAGVLLLAITAACASAWRRRPHWLVGWLWFVGMLVPVIGMHDQARADRYMYLPGIGLSLLACWGVADLAAGSPRVRRALVPAAAVLIAAFGVASRVQLAHWRDAEAIYRRALAVSPDDVRLLYDLGTLLSEQERHDEAAALLSRVLEIEPGYPAALMNLAHVCLAQGRYDEAISHYLAVVEIYPRQPMIHYNLGVAYARAWKLREAISHFERALEREPDLHAAREGLIGALLKQGRSDEALTQLHELLARSPDHPRARELLEQLAPGGAG